MDRTKDEIRIACEAFLEDWDRQQWTQDHGEWVSEQWNEEREEYAEAAADLAELIEDIPESTRAIHLDLDSIREAVDRLAQAAADLGGQVTPDESDYIAEGLIDPDCVSDSADSLNVSARWEGWDCTEGWSAYRAGDDLYVRWVRNAYGNRHNRDLWAKVSTGFFADE